MYKYKYLGLHANHQIFLSDFNLNLDFVDRFFIIAPNIKFRANPSCGSRAGKCGWSDMKLEGAFRD